MTTYTHAFVVAGKRASWVLPRCEVCREFADHPLHVAAPVPLCGVRLYRCCGQGWLECERPAGHELQTPHTAEGVDW